jgi:hypothetical protein
VSDHPSLEEIERLLTAPESEEARLLAHVLLCGECRKGALGLLKVPRPSTHARFRTRFDQMDDYLGQVEALLEELLSEEEP